MREESRRFAMWTGQATGTSWRSLVVFAWRWRDRQTRRDARRRVIQRAERALLGAAMSAGLLLVERRLNAAGAKEAVTPREPSSSR